MKKVVKKNQVFNFGKTFNVQKCFECQESNKYGSSCFYCKNYASEMVQVDGTIENFINKNRKLFKTDGSVKITNTNDAYDLMYALNDEFAIPFKSNNLFWDADSNSISIQRLYRQSDLWVTLATVSLHIRTDYGVSVYKNTNPSSNKALKVANKISSILQQSAEFIQSEEKP